MGHRSNYGKFFTIFALVFGAAIDPNPQKANFQELLSEIEGLNYLLKIINFSS